jgi:hypothetical protein
VCVCVCVCVCVRACNTCVFQSNGRYRWTPQQSCAVHSDQQPSAVTLATCNAHVGCCGSAAFMTGGHAAACSQWATSAPSVVPCTKSAAPIIPPQHTTCASCARHLNAPLESRCQAAKLSLWFGGVCHNGPPAPSIIIHPHHHRCTSSKAAKHSTCRTPPPVHCRRAHGALRHKKTQRAQSTRHMRALVDHRTCRNTAASAADARGQHAK